MTYKIKMISHTIVYGDFIIIIKINFHFHKETCKCVVLIDENFQNLNVCMQFFLLKFIQFKIDFPGFSRHEFGRALLFSSKM